jgi:hypothetical protein
MPLTLHVTSKGFSSNFQEWTGPNGSGVNVKPIGPVSYVSSDPTIATVDPATGVGASAGVGTATITGTDAGNSLTASDTVTVIADPAVSATLGLTANP